MLSWQKEPGIRVQGSRPLDNSKVQAPAIVRLPDGRFRLFYTAIGSAKPFPECQGYILSAISEDGLNFRTEPGIRVAPQPALPDLSLRLIGPSIARCGDGRWRMYVEGRGPAAQPTVIASAISDNLTDWAIEPGVRLRTKGGVGAPRFIPQGGDRGRMFFIDSSWEYEDGRPTRRVAQGVASAVTADGLNFRVEPGCRLRDRQGWYDNLGITAAEVIPPDRAGEPWTMIFSAWQDVPPGTVVPHHPSHPGQPGGKSPPADFAAASIASDIAGYRSRIFAAASVDGVTWGPAQCVVAGGGYESDEPDAVHAEDMSLIRLGEKSYRMYYAACDRRGNWRIVSAICG